MLYESFGDAGVDVVMAHVVADAEGAPSERELGQVARSQDDAAVCVRQAEEIVGSQARLDVLEGDVVDLLAPAEGMAHVFEHLQGGGANVDF